jgi:hypothetical protein
MERLIFSARSCSGLTGISADATKAPPNRHQYLKIVPDIDGVASASESNGNIGVHRRLSAV